MDLLTTISNEFDVPKIEDNQKIWFFRTKAGQYYHDFQINSFIGLGWDLISPEMIRDESTTRERKKEIIENLYPDEKRPGLILGQMETFYNQMKEGDFIVIPSAGGKQIAIGAIGEFCNEIEHKIDLEDYPKCEYQHKRFVTWLKKVDAWQDIYLFKALRAQQTISDITNEAALVLRNLFPIYVSEDTVHFMLQKPTNEDYNALENVEMIMCMLNIVEEVAKLYGMEDFKKDISLKTAVGSPGFLEVILPGTPVAVFVVCLLRYIIGKEKSPDGSVTTGILALITKINELLNDYHNRKKTDAEVAQIVATTRLTDAQTQKTLAEVEMIRVGIEAQKSQSTEAGFETKIKYEQIAFLESGKTTIQVKEEQEQLSIPHMEQVGNQIDNIIANGEKLCEAAANNGISFDGKKIEKVS